MGRWSVHLARQFLDFAAIGAARRVLDVGAGTGSLTAAIAATTGARRIVGVDPMPQFVRSAKQQFEAPRVTFAWGDARELPFPAAKFDATLAQLSLHHIANGRIAVGEMMRVTRSGGVVAACEWDAGPGMEMFHVLRETLVRVYPEAEAQFSARRRYSDRGELLALWRDCGIADAEECALTVPLHFTGFEDFWSPFLDSPSNVAGCFKTLPPPVKDDFRLALRRALLGTKWNGPIELKARAWAVRGHVP
jgi:SAM-dependent methyltransferase